MDLAMRGRSAALVALVAAMLPLASCGPNRPTPRALDAAFMKAVTSPIPGAHATLFATGTGAVDGAPMVSACVTDAGYCALAAPVSAGENCLCDTGTFSYGGKTARPPATIDQQ